MVVVVAFSLPGSDHSLHWPTVRRVSTGQDFRLRALLHSSSVRLVTIESTGKGERIVENLSTCLADGECTVETNESEIVSGGASATCDQVRKSQND